MRSFYLVVLIILLGFVFNIAAQDEFNVNSYTISEMLSLKDPIDPEYGRYDAYEIFINQGDRFAVDLQSDAFRPVFFLFSPNGNTIFKYSVGSNTTLMFDTTCSETGNWELYIVCDTAFIGSYNCKISFAAPNSLKLPENSDFCRTLNFILAHSQADFRFLRGTIIDAELKKWYSTVVFPESKSSEIHQDFNTKLISSIYSGDDPEMAENRYNEIINKITKCLGTKWSIENEIQSVPNDNSHSKSKSIKSNNIEDKRYIQVEITDFSPENEASGFRYIVNVIIGNDN